MSHKPTKTKGQGKLYDYLRGYEHAGFTGMSKSMCLRSVAELIKDEVTLLFDEEVSNSPEIQSIIEHLDRYLTSFYQKMKDSPRPASIKWLADNMKVDYSSMSDLVSFIFTQARDSECYYFMPLTRGGQLTNIQIDLSEKCPKYLTQKCKFCLLSIARDTDDVDHIFCETRLPFTRELAMAVLKLLNFLVVKHNISSDNLDNYHMLFQHILAPAKIFELMNPTGKVREEMILDAEKLLTSEPLDQSSESYQYWRLVLYAVFADINEGKLPYIRPIVQALKQARSKMDTPYDPYNDPYLSMKGTGQSKFTGCYSSLQSSAYEVDYYVDQPEVKAFDQKVGYTSYYKKYANIIDVEKDRVFCIRTMAINNPGKFKIRIIHIFDNAIQDRANYLQRRTSAFLEGLVTDCTFNQEKGHKFAKEVSLEWFLNEPENRPGIYGFDFSNATDTLDQGFQWEVLNFLFGKEIADFWLFISKIPKFLQHTDGSYTRYDQKCGQPQGGLSSFNDFAICHHFIFLMNMKVNHMEDINSRYVYRVLGDDSLVIVRNEIDIFSPGHRQKYDESDPFDRSDFEFTHFKICSEYAGFIINYDKSHSVHYDSKEAKVEFAKVTFRNGGFFSPIPFRLAMKYSKSFEDRMAVAIWRGARDETNCREFMNLLLDKYCEDDTVVDLIKCNALGKYLEPFADERRYKEAWLARVRYAYALIAISSNLVFMTLEDKERDWVELDTWEIACTDIFTKQVQEDILNDLPTDHKLIQVLNDNLESAELLKFIYSYEDADDQYLAMLIATTTRRVVMKNDWVEILDELYRTTSIINSARKNPNVDVSMCFPDFEYSDMEIIDQIVNMTMTRGTSKAPRDFTYVIFSKMLKILWTLDEVLGECPHCYLH